jgi:hypothetical protein
MGVETSATRKAELDIKPNFQRRSKSRDEVEREVCNMFKTKGLNHGSQNKREKKAP